MVRVTNLVVVRVTMEVDRVVMEYCLFLDKLLHNTNGAVKYADANRISAMLPKATPNRG